VEKILMDTLPSFQTSFKPLALMQTAWQAILNPLLRNPSLSSRIITRVELSTGANQISHGLGRKLQGWRIVRQRSAASIYDDQDNNPRSDLTLSLVSSAPTVCDLEVF
jgi:hypothetical protein